MIEAVIDFSTTGRLPPRTPLSAFDRSTEEPDPADAFDAEVAAMFPSPTQRLDAAREAGTPLGDAASLASALERTGFDRDRLERMKATFVASRGNLSEVARTHDVPVRTVARLVAELDWGLYGVALESQEKSRITRLESLAAMLEQQMFTLGESLGVERKALDDVTEKGLNSAYVASLSQRSGAFNAVFDRWLRVMELLEPETFGGSTGAARERGLITPDVAGGVEGVKREMADFAARVAVGVVQGMREELRPHDRDVIRLS